MPLPVGFGPESLPPPPDPPEPLPLGSLPPPVPFPGGVGNTRKDPEAFASLINDVETKIFAALPDETWVYPGHGDDTTLGAERPHLPEWRARGW